MMKVVFERRAGGGSHDVQSQRPSVFPSGCKVESVFLNIEAVNTHRDKPVVNMKYDFSSFKHKRLNTSRSVNET